MTEYSPPGHAFLRGKTDYRDGYALGENPYEDRTSYDYEAWNAGWVSAKKNDPALAPVLIDAPAQEPPTEPEPEPAVTTTPERWLHSMWGWMTDEEYIARIEPIRKEQELAWFKVGCSRDEIIKRFSEWPRGGPRYAFTVGDGTE